MLYPKAWSVWAGQEPGPARTLIHHLTPAREMAFMISLGCYQLLRMVVTRGFCGGCVVLCCAVVSGAELERTKRRENSDRTPPFPALAPAGWPRWGGLPRANEVGLQASAVLPEPHSTLTRAHSHAHTCACAWLSLSASPGAKTELMVMSEGDREGKKKKSTGRLAGLGLWQQAANSFISCSAEYKSAETF